jgi:hypothetical protein
VWYKLVESEFERGVPNRDIQKLLKDSYGIDVSYHAVRSYAYRYRNRHGYYGDMDTESDIVYKDKKTGDTPETVDELWDAMINLQEKMEQVDTKQTSATIEIRQNKPVGIVKWGDLHIGSRGTNYRALRRDMETLQNTDGVYIIGMGDYKDNANAFIHQNEKESIVRPSLQDKFVIDVFAGLIGKWLAIVAGCHDTWSYKLDDRDCIEYLCSVTGAVNLWHGGELNIQLGGQEYKFRVRHKFQRESQLNTTNAQRALLDTFGVCDEIALAHKHFPDMQMLDRQGQKVIYIRSGSYKVLDDFGQQIAGYVGKIGVPITVIYPDRHHLVPFSELEDGIRFLKAERESY